MVKIIECVEAHYNIQAAEFGTVYKWRPESVMIECECGEMVTLTASSTTCEECGAGHTGLVRENLAVRRSREDKEVHPWRYSEKNGNSTSLPY